jgi:ATP/maltotriose-dependent transcriptional regulator MalT
MRVTKRELEVVEVVYEAKTNQEIAGALSISLSTVKQHLRNIFVKTQVKHRTQLVRYARLVKLVQSWRNLHTRRPLTWEKHPLRFPTALS